MGLTGGQSTFSGSREYYWKGASNPVLHLTRSPERPMQPSVGARWEGNFDPKPKKKRCKEKGTAVNGTASALKWLASGVLKVAYEPWEKKGSVVPAP